MLESFPVATIVATVLGFLAGLGVGGGSLLILWLTVVLGMEYPAARSINLLFFLPAAFLSSCLRSKAGTLSWKRLLPGIAAGCLAAVLSSRISLRLDLEILKKCFGTLLLFTGLRELRWHPGKKA